MRRLLRALAFSLTTWAASAAAWDQAGHMLVGQIAWSRLTPEARRQITELLQSLPNTYNAGRTYTFITANCWMDDMRSAPNYAWSRWHYVNIPWTADASGFAFPEGQHAVWAIHRSEGLLRNDQLGAAEKAEAVAILIHVIGDLHQPLHTCDRNGDRGGNGYLIHGVPFSDLWPGTAPNLHTFWDKAFRFEAHAAANVELWRSPTVESRPVAPDAGVIASEAAKIANRWPETAFTERELGGTAEDWARESYELACRKAYPPGEPPDNAAVQTIDPAFCHEANEVATRRIAQAGYRLARVVEQVSARVGGPPAARIGPTPGNPK